LILDDFAMREFTPGQADDLYELVTERTKKSLIITANRSASKVGAKSSTTIP
jgi:DNA replication protein DnaC